MYTEPIESEKKYRALEKLGQELGIPVPQCFIETEVTMPDGEVFRNKTRSHSLKRNAYNFLFGLMANKDLTDTTFGAGFLSLKLAAGTVRHSGQMALPVAVNPNSGSIMGIDGDTPFYYAGGYNAPAAYDGAGILVGSSDTAETFEDCALATQILHGNVSGKLMYNATNPHVTSYDAGSKTLSDSLSRFFNNNSGGDITIKEVGIISGMVIYSNWAEVYLLSRDVLVTPVLVPDSGQLKVTYTNALVYPA